MTATIVNTEMQAAWDGDEGQDWARDWQHYDRAARGYHLRLLEAVGVSAGDRVLDIGCGNGEVTRDAARAATGGSALGVDLSSQMIAKAEELAKAEGLTNAAFERADAQVHPFAPDAHDVVVSRFGAMFFADPVAAFTNLARTTRPGGRLVLVSWQELAENAWLQAIRGALAMGRELPAPPTGAPGPFGLADPSAVQAVLESAGFDDISCEAVREPLWAGADAEDAFGFLSRTGVAKGLLGGLGPADQERALDALRTTLAAHEGPDGVQLGSAAWLFVARRRTVA